MIAVTEADLRYVLLALLILAAVIWIVRNLR